jgi:hypothetical protein
MPRHRSALLRVDELERRDAPATLVSPYKLTYQDPDGDNVSVTFSKPILTLSNVGTIFAFDTGNVNGSNTTPQQLRGIGLRSLGSAAAGTAITVTATRSPVHGGDGFAAVGQIDSTDIDLGTIRIDGDLGRIRAGDSDPARPALRGLRVQSLGRFGLGTGAIDLRSRVSGRLGSLTVRSDIHGVIVEVYGDLGPVAVGGSLVGTADGGVTISVTGAIGPVVIKGDMVGGSGDASGTISAGGALAGVTIGGSLRGGTGAGSGAIFADGVMGPLAIRGDVAGGGGLNSGSISSRTRISAITIGGSLLSGPGFVSGTISSGGGIGAIKIGGNVIGVAGSAVPIISALGSIGSTAMTDVAIASLTVGGRVESAIIQAGVNLVGGGLNADAQIGAVTVGGDWVASSIAAGATQGTDLFFGDSDDTKFSGFGVNDNSLVSSKIASVTIGGQILGTVEGADHFGIVAEAVGAVTVGGIRLPLTSGAHNDNLVVGITGDFTVREI